MKIGVGSYQAGEKKKPRTGGRCPGLKRGGGPEVKKQGENQFKKTFK